MSYQDLRYNDVAFKAAHNSEERDESLAEQMTFHPENPSNAGCSGIELDIVQKSDAWEWSVNHSGSYNPAPDAQLSAYLLQVMAWAAAQPGGEHRAITIHLDIKNTPMSDAEFPDRIDAYIANVIAANRIFSPGALIGGPYNDLVSGAQFTGWPTLGELESRFIIVLTGDESRKASYAANDPKNRLCFSDVAQSTNPPQYPDLQKGDRIFLNYHLYSDDYDTWYGQLQFIATQPGFISRGYVLNSDGIWTKAQNAALNIMATDKITGHSWAHNGDEPFMELKMADDAESLENTEASVEQSGREA